jgi:hypothetical protein
MLVIALLSSLLLEDFLPQTETYVLHNQKVTSWNWRLNVYNFNEESWAISEQNTNKKKKKTSRTRRKFEMNIDRRGIRSSCPCD